MVQDRNFAQSFCLNENFAGGLQTGLSPESIKPPALDKFCSQITYQNQNLILIFGSRQNVLQQNMFERKINFCGLESILETRNAEN